MITINVLEDDYVSRHIIISYDFCCTLAESIKHKDDEDNTLYFNEDGDNIRPLTKYKYKNLISNRVVKTSSKTLVYGIY
jgi:hypothetical protein